jgi:hypothetical protein
MLNVSDIQERARARYNATNDKFFSDQFMRDCIFDAQSQLAKDGYVIENTLETDSLANIREYSYPDNTLAVKSVHYDYKRLTKVALRFDPKTSVTDPTGTPRTYAVWDNVIILYNTPDQDDKKIQIKVYSYPQDIETNSSPLEVPQEYREDLIHFCLAQMANKDQNTAMYDRYIARWDKKIQEAKRQRKKRLRADSPARVKDDYFGYDRVVTVEGALYRGW